MEGARTGSGVATGEDGERGGKYARTGWRVDVEARHNGAMSFCNAGARHNGTIS